MSFFQQHPKIGSLIANQCVTKHAFLQIISVLIALKTTIFLQESGF